LKFRKHAEIQTSNTGGAKIATGGGALPSNFNIECSYQEFDALLQTLLIDSEKEKSIRIV
jgi:hypothetical protein